MYKQNKYITIKEFSFKDAMQIIKTNRESERIIIDQHRVNLKSQRYFVFEKSNVCAVCNAIGTKMLLQKLESDKDATSAHFNLYTNDNILMTKDHIIPKSKGGKNFLSNYQTLCFVCNQLKGNNLN